MGTSIRRHFFASRDIDSKRTVREFRWCSYCILAFIFCCTTALQAASNIPSNFVLIREGEFVMGSPFSEEEREWNEAQHRVKVSDFYISRYEVTVAEFRKFADETGYRTGAEKSNNPVSFLQELFSGKTTPNWRQTVSGQERTQAEEYHPVTLVSWNDAVAYCQWLSKKTGKVFRLPTEAEWEYACRAETTTPFNTGGNLTTAQANYDGNYPYGNNRKGVYRKNTVPVDGFTPNRWGLYNMHGNVAEWCGDWYSDKYYDACKTLGVVTNPTGAGTGTNRVIRGGSWNDEARYCRSADRNDSIPDYRYINVGFRVVMVP